MLENRFLVRIWACLYVSVKTFENSFVTKSSFSVGSKGLSVNDPILNFCRDKRPSLKNEKPYQEDPFTRDFGTSSFDGRDPFSGGLVGVVKKKKDMLKQTDFHDPARESFEAEACGIGGKDCQETG